MAYRLRGRSCLYLDGSGRADWNDALPALRRLSAGIMPFAPMDGRLEFRNDLSVPLECVAYVPCRRPPTELADDDIHFTVVSGKPPTAPLPTLTVAGAMLWLERQASRP